MKRIQSLNNPTAGLDSYLAEEGNGAKDWDGFRSHDAGVSYRLFAEALVDIQHGLCGYCEIDIDERDRQVEHVVPRSDPKHGVAHILHYANMIACCKGGTLQIDNEDRGTQAGTAQSKVAVKPRATWWTRISSILERCPRCRR